MTCVSGFCPAIVTVSGAKTKKPATCRDAAPASAAAALRCRQPLGAKPFSMIIAGVGGTGVVTIGAIVGMAAHLEGAGCGVMDMAGLAQKGGTVFTHVKLAERPADINAIRVAAAEADLVLGCDLVASGSKKVLGAIRKNDTAIVVNTAALFPGEITRDPDYDLPKARLKTLLRETAGDSARFVDATRAATALLGTSLAANMFMLGYAWQAGMVPLSESSILRAITLNGEAVSMNRDAFALGRRASAFPDEIGAMVDAAQPRARQQAPARSFDEIVARRERVLVAYQDQAYAERYRTLVDRARSAEKTYAPGSTAFSEAVAKGFFKLLAIKDEYEVARLYSDGAFAKQMAETFDGDVAGDLPSRPADHDPSRQERRRGEDQIRPLDRQALPTSCAGASGYAAHRSTCSAMARSGGRNASSPPTTRR